jgi:hypothetical protein
MNEVSVTRWQAAVTAIAPVVLLAGYAYHPYIHNLTDGTAVASAALDTTRWGLSHLLVAVGSGFIALAFLAVRSALRTRGEERWSRVALPFVVMGCTLFAVLPGMEFALLAVIDTGADVAATRAAVEALDPWFLPILLTGSTVFALGALGFAAAIVRSRMLSPAATWLVVGALVVMAMARFVPFGLILQYVGGVAGIVGLWPLAFAMLKHAEAPNVGPQQASSAI